MKKNDSRFAASMVKIFAALFVCATPLCATPSAAVMTCEKGSNNDLREARLRLGGDLGDKAAFSLGGDFCTKSLRTLASVGYEVTDLDAVKVSAEYRNQKLDYNFARTTTEVRKRHQTAFGAAYQRKLNLDWISSMDVAAGYSYAPSQTLDTATTDTYTDYRRLAGTRFYTVSVGATAAAWENATVRVSACVDHFEINRSYNGSRRVTGVGLGVNLNQKINENFSAEIRAEHHRAYNICGVALNCLSLKKSLVVGVFVDRTHTKYNLPNTTTAGLQLSYRLGADNPTGTSNGVSEWVNIPAFSQPEVLVATDELQAYNPT